MREIRECAICGNAYVATRANCKYCCKECAEQGNRMIARENNGKYKAGEKIAIKRELSNAKKVIEQVTHKMTITEIAVAANKAGMSYGQYVSQMGL